MGDDLLKTHLAEDLPKINHALIQAINELPSACKPAAGHIISAGGKRLRPFLVVLMARATGQPGSEIYRLASTMEMLHAATLLHDDILDGAMLRRGKPASHTLFGEAQTILAGDALLALGNAIIAEFGRPELSKAFSVATMETAAGEIREMNALRDPDTSQADYLAIARGKTGCLIAQSCALGALYASKNEELAQSAASYGEALGIAFQLVDDALDFAPASQTGKPACGDLREGKMTEPLRLYRASLEPDERSEFDSMFRCGDISQATQAKICAAIPAFVNQTLCLADNFLDHALEILAHFPASPELAILRSLPSYIRNRSH